MQFIKIYTNLLRQKFLKLNKLEVILTFIVLSIIIYTHSHNMFFFPYYENDEGTYMSQAWAITNLNKLAPYTYWYDHSPLGWMILAFFSQLLGGYNAFGNAINTGRVIMLLMHISSTIMIMATTKKITNNYYSGLIAALIFSLFPLGNVFQRRVLLDNIMVFLLAFSVYFCTDKKLNLTHLFASAVLLGMSILSKESAIFFIPGMLYLVYSGLEPKRRVFGIFVWLGTLASVVSLYLILAIQKTELFPSDNKVSLLGTMAYQASRGRGLAFWRDGSDFNISLDAWIGTDITAMIAFGLIALVSAIVIIRKNYDSRFMGICLLCLFYVLFLIRGKTVLEFYIIPMFFVFGILGGIVINYINIKINKKYFFNFISLAIILTLMVGIQFKVNSSALYKDEVTPYLELNQWIVNNINQNAQISIDCGIYMDLQNPKAGGKVFKNADWYWKNDYDPDIRIKKLGDNPLNIDYIFETFQYLSDIESNATPFNKVAYYESKKIVDFSKNGITANLLQVVKDKNIILQNSWNNYKKENIYNGATYDKTNKDITSQSQSFILLRSVMNNDPSSFDTIWNWTKTNLQKRTTDKLFLSKVKLIDPTNIQTLNDQSTTDADLDIALALQIASKKWNNPAYLDETKLIINDIWNNRVVTLGSNLAIIPFISQKEKGLELINPSHFSPAHYRMFATIDKDPKHKWNDLAFETYKTLDSILDSYRFIPNWIVYNYRLNKWESATKIMGPTSDDFGFESSRLFWRLNLDKELFNYNDTTKLSEKIVPFFENDFKKNGIIYTAYNQNGEALQNYETTANDAGIYSMFTLFDNDKKYSYWKNKFIERIDLQTMTLDSKNNLYNQNYGAIIFGTKEGQLKNIITK
jgi:endo-1,4-beta-D-glucanase Y/4-amino-4-deoxy-L-arabinose transferase-like glycosyltransferase